MQKEKLMELKLAIETETRISEEIAKKREEFENQNKELFSKQKTLRQNIIDCKDVLSMMEEEKFREECERQDIKLKDGLKKRIGGMGIRVGETLIYDVEKAFNWAEKHSIALALDKKVFESFVKSQSKDLKQAKLDFVTTDEKITVTFPKEIKLED